jgi:putative redox protein
MEVQVRHRGNKKTEAYARFHRIVCDQPFAEGGHDTGMTPPELMLSALGCCAMHYAVEYLRARNLPLDAVNMRVSAEKGGAPRPRLMDIGIELDAPALTPRAREGLVRAVETCLLHRTLADPPRLRIALVDHPAGNAPAYKTLAEQRP